MLKNNSAFTFVELVVVITLVSIIGTIWMMSYSGYARDARDVTRKTELQNIQKVLTLYDIKHSYFPLPDNSSSITHSWSIVWHQGVFWDEVHRAVRILSNKPVDPSHGIEYSYSVLSNKKEYELGAVFEWEKYAYIPGISQTYAADTLAYIIWNYNSRFTANKNGKKIDVITLPNITSSREWDHTVNDIVSENLLVMNKKRNLPANYNAWDFDQSWLVEEWIENPVSFSWDYSELKTIEQKRVFIQNLQNNYKSSSHINNPEAQSKLQSLLDIDTTKDIQVESFFEKMSSLHLWGFWY